jgi:hypothetical protein
MPSVRPKVVLPRWGSTLKGSWWLSEGLEPMTADFIELDDRGRAPLRKYARPKGRYLVEVDEEGVIHLYPAAVMTELEVAMWRHRPQDAARIDASLADPGHLVELTQEEL